MGGGRVQWLTVECCEQLLVSCAPPPCVPMPVALCLLPAVLHCLLAEPQLQCCAVLHDYLHR